MKLFYLFSIKLWNGKMLKRLERPPKINHLDAEMVRGEEEERLLNYRLASFNLNWIRNGSFFAFGFLDQVKQ
jgi:hypothetical protein